MTRDDFNAFCGSLAHATHVVQWGGADVWKVGGKMFATMWDGDDPYAGVTFKASPMSYELLRAEPGLRPAPYLASRGLKWIQRFTDESMSDHDLERYLRHSYDLVLAGLPRKTRVALAGGAASPLSRPSAPRRAPGSGRGTGRGSRPS
jgi:predicted DNA-binding protein (MmcQ/YjbR family)